MLQEGLGRKPIWMGVCALTHPMSMSWRPDPTANSGRLLAGAVLPERSCRRTMPTFISICALVHGPHTTLSPAGRTVACCPPETTFSCQTGPPFEGRQPAARLCPPTRGPCPSTPCGRERHGNVRETQLAKNRRGKAWKASQVRPNLGGRPTCNAVFTE